MQSGRLPGVGRFCRMMGLPVTEWSGVGKDHPYLFMYYRFFFGEMRSYSHDHPLKTSRELLRQ
jgi:hypothetical protein